MKQFALRSGKERAEVGRKGEDCNPCTGFGFVETNETKPWSGLPVSNCYF